MRTPAAPLVSRPEAALLPGLTGDGIVLRPLDKKHTGALFEAALASKPELEPWMPWCHADYARTDAASFAGSRADAWKQSIEYAFAIIESDSGRFLGCCGLNEIHPLHRTANLGYWVRTDATKRGYASTAARMLARFGFLHLGLRRIEIVAAIGNRASQRAAEKAGATPEGRLRNRLCIHGVSHDAMVYSFIPADFEIAG